MFWTLWKACNPIPKEIHCIWEIFKAWTKWMCSMNIGYMCQWTQKHKNAKGFPGNHFKHTQWSLKRLIIQSTKTLRSDSVTSDCVSRTGFLTIRNKNESPSTLSRKPQSVSGSVDNVQNYASWVGPTIRSCALSFHSLLDGIKSKNMHFASRWAKQFVHILFSFLDLLHERKTKNIKCPLY